MKIVSPEEKSVIQKDFREIWDSKMARSTMMVVPVVLLIVLPIIFLAVILNAPMDQINGIDRMIKLLPAEEKGLSVRQAMMYLVTNMLFPMFFLIIPLMMSSVSAANSFVGERERGTLETLLLTPLSLKRIFRAKVFGCTFFSAVATAVSFVVFSVITAVGDILLEMPFFLNWNWLVLVFLLAPGITVFGVVFMVLISAKSKSYLESVQTSGYIVLPLIFLFIGPLSGLFQLNAFILSIIAAAVIAVDFPLWMIAAHSFSPEKLLR